MTIINTDSVIMPEPSLSPEIMQEIASVMTDERITGNAQEKTSLKTKGEIFSTLNFLSFESVNQNGTV